MERAIRWYRKGIMEYDAFTKHTCLWVGLEIINPIIKDKYLEDITTHPLHYYNNEQKPDELISLAGVKFLLLERCHYSYDEWKSIKDTRDLIIHGSEPLEALKNRVAEHLPKLERALQIGIFESMDLSEEKISELIRLSYPPFSKTELLFYVILNNFDKKTFIGRELPELCVEKININHSDVKEEHVVTISTSHKMKNYSGSYRQFKYALKGSIDPEFTKRESKIIENSVKKESKFSRLKRFIFECLKKN
jgi:hypothetical protein